MKSLKELETMRKSLKELENTMEILLIKLNKRYKKNIKIEREKLIKKISIDYNLNLDELMKRYIDKELLNEKILEIINIKGIEYFYENTENGKILNKDNEIVGIYKDNNFILEK